MTVSIEETMSQGHGERSPDRDDSYFPNPVKELPMSHTLSMHYRLSSVRGQLCSRHYKDRLTGYGNKSLDQIFFCDPVVIELICYRTRAKQLINEGNTTGGLKKIGRDSPDF